MKKEIHPEYQDILFVDTSTGFKFVCGSTLKPKEKEKFEGKEYPVYRVAISSASHPFFSDKQQFIDTEGRVDKFKKRYIVQPKQEKKEGQNEAEDKKQSSKKLKDTKKSVKTKSKVAAKPSSKKTETATPKDTKSKK